MFLLYNFLSSLVSRRSSKFLLSREWKLCRETETKVDVVTRHQYGIPGPGFHIISLGNQWWRPEMSAVFFGLRVILIFFFSNMSRMKRIRWLTNVMWSYRGWRKKVKSYLRIWRMKERPMTRSGQYHGNPLHKYHSWGRGGGGTRQSFILVISSPRSNPSPFYTPFLTEKGTPFVHLPLTNGTPFMHPFWVYATGGQSWSQEDGKTLVLDKRERAIASVFCRELHLTSLCSGFFQT